MEPMSYETACVVVARYNDCRCVRTVSREMRLPYAACFDFVTWLWNRTFVSHEDFTKRLPHNSLIQAPSKITWVEYLYANNCDAEKVARSVGWPLTDVLRTCRGPRQWMRADRQPLRRKSAICRDRGPSKTDPSEDEIYRIARELRLQRPESQQEEETPRVEIKQLSFSVR